MEKIEVNEFQTPITEELLSKYPQEVQDDFFEFIHTVPFIKSLIAPDRKRAKDLPRDDKGRIIVDLAHPHIIEDMDYFRPSALHFIKYGRYTDFRPNKNPNSAFGKWIRQEIHRCWEGMVRPSDGEWVTGLMYFYLNYVPMMVTKASDDPKKRTASRVEGFPEVWESTYWRFHYLDQARNGGLYNNFEGGNHAVELSRRGSGKSFSLASIMAHNLILGQSQEAHKRTTTILTAYLREYLAEKDGTLSKFTPIKSFLAEHTQFSRRMLIDSPHKMSWKSGYKDKLTGADVGDQNILLGLSSKDDEGKIRGKRGDILFEEFGSFKGLIDIYNNVRDGMKEGKFVYGFAYLVGTAGDKDSDFHGAQELVYNPQGYDVYALPNVWDKPNQGRPWFALFTPAYVCTKGYYNKDGVSDVTASILFRLMERYAAKYQTDDPNTIIKVVSNMPFTPAEAMIKSTSTMFPTVDIDNRLLEINSDPNFYDNVYTGQLVINDDKVEFSPTSDVPIRFYNSKDNKNMKGAVEIFEMPQKDQDGKVYENRYILGSDPYDNDESTTNSLGSTFVLDLWTDRIVAEYTGRPPMADDYFEITRRLCLFYNGRLNYENNKKGLYAHFVKMNSTYLLTDTLEILVDKQMVKTRGYGNTAKGTNATLAVNGWARQLLAKWLLLPKEKFIKEGDEEKQVTVPNLYFIKNKALLIELSQWNPLGNFDRCVLRGTSIMTIDGSKNVEDVAKGDFILTSSGTYCKVNKTMVNDFKGVICNLRANGDYRNLYCTDNHPILIRHQGHIRRKKWKQDKTNLSVSEYVRADSINVDSDFILIPRRKELPDCFISDDLLYALGWYIADGNVSSGNYVKFFLQEDQYEIGLDLVKILNDHWRREDTFVKSHIDKNGRKVSSYFTPQGALATITHSRRKYKGEFTKMWIVSIASSEAVEFFTTFGGKPNAKDICEKLYNTKGLLPLIKGFFEGDGHYRCSVRSDGYERNNLELSSIYENLILKVRQILLDEGIWASLRYIKPRNKRHLPQYNINVSGDNVLPIIVGSKKFKQVNRCDRKWTREAFIMDDFGFWVKLKHYTKSNYEGNTFNLEVDVDPSYVANGITTHNCSSMGMLMLLREDKLKYMGGEYKFGKEDDYDPDYKLNDPYFTDNYKEPVDEEHRFELWEG